MHIVFVGLKGATRRNRACDTRLGYVKQLLEERHKVTISERNFMEPLRLLWLHRNKPVDVLHVYSNHYVLMPLYWLIARIMGARVVAEYVEYRSSFDWENCKVYILPVLWYHRMNAYLFDRYAAKLWDGCLPISDFLMQKAHEVNPDLKMLKVAPLCNLDLFEQNKLPSPEAKPYILYCGSRDYKEVAEMIEEAYRMSRLKDKVGLRLLLDGNLDYDVLVSYFKHAEALLIPLRNNIRDIARFPNKICEYTASQSIVITTPYGEMPHYFSDGKNAIIADDYSVSALTDCFNRMADGYYDMAALREASWQTAVQHFSLDAYREVLFHFLDEIVYNK